MSNIYIATSPPKTNPSGIVQRKQSHSKDEIERVVPASKRPDGSMRKERKIRPGYTPPEDIKRYKPPQQRHVQTSLLTDAMQNLSISKNSESPKSGSRWNNGNWRERKNNPSMNTPSPVQDSKANSINTSSSDGANHAQSISKDIESLQVKEKPRSVPSVEQATTSKDLYKEP